MSKTPGTWEADNSAMVDVIYLHVDGLADRRIAEFIGPDAAENAAKAAHAVNCYGELLEACKLALEAFERYEMGPDELTMCDCVYDVVKNGVGLPEIVRAAIAKAETTA